MHTIFKIILFVVLITSLSSNAFAKGPFKFMGDGKVNVGRGYNGDVKSITYRNGDGSYVKDGLKQINSIYGTNYDSPEARMSLRLIELLDYLEDHFGGKAIKIISGYRSPDHNNSLRAGGKLAASSSLHIDAEATDIVLDGVSSATIYDYLFQKDCCGIGYYHGKTIHIDTGPPRFWDEKTSGTEKKEPPLNEHITLKTESDYYNEGGKIGLKFSRVTDYPIGVKETMVITCKEGEHESKKNIGASFINSASSNGKGCYQLNGRKEGRLISSMIPNIKIKGDEALCRVRAYFCDPKTEKMPESVESNPFSVSKLSIAEK